VSEKVYDEEETRQEQAKRLITYSINRRSEETRKLVQRLTLHAKHLSRSDRMAAIEYLRREADLVVGLLEQTGDEEVREFAFPSDAIEQEWELTYE
jgi:uncharacterized FlaG/YvyC family protein